MVRGNAEKLCTIKDSWTFSTCKIHQERVQALITILKLIQISTTFFLTLKTDFERKVSKNELEEEAE